MSEQTLIPIKNIYHMFCYAWEYFSNGDESWLDIEPGPHNVELLAKMFNYCLFKITKYGINRYYVNNVNELSTVRGKINIKETISNRSLINKRLVCEYDEYSNNIPINQIIKYTLLRLTSDNYVDNSTKYYLRSQLKYFNGVDTLVPTIKNVKKLKFDRNNSINRTIICISQMLYENQMPLDNIGENKLFKYSNEILMNTVFEKFLLNFYKSKLKYYGATVKSSKLNWQLQPGALNLNKSFSVDEHAPQRITDVEITTNKGTKIIIDAKYYEKTLDKSRWGNEERVRAQHLNQVRGYVLDSARNIKRIGVLIYPQVDIDIHDGKLIEIEGSPIIYKTIDLSMNWQLIEDDLFNFITKIIDTLDK